MTSLVARCTKATSSVKTGRAPFSGTFGGLLQQTTHKTLVNRSRRYRNNGTKYLKVVSALADGESNGETMSSWDDGIGDAEINAQNFCLIESGETIQDFADMNLETITSGIEERRNRVFLLMEEVRRLRIQQKLKEGELLEIVEQEQFNMDYESAIPLMPPLTDSDLKVYYSTFLAYIAAFILFGGFIAPFVEPKLGIGGTNYAEFIDSVGLPHILSQVDPFVASFTGGAVGVVTSLLLVEMKNVEVQVSKRCQYCSGSGYLGCGTCSGKGVLLVDVNKATSTAGPKCKCVTCSGSGKVMCTSCLCTGMALATEHDPRIDPFD